MSAHSLHPCVEEEHREHWNEDEEAPLVDLLQQNSLCVKQRDPRVLACIASVWLLLCEGNSLYIPISLH